MKRTVRTGLPARGMPLAGALFLAGAVCAASMADRIAAMPRAVTSSDGFVRVVATDDPRDVVGFRAPVMQFASSEANALRKAFGLGEGKTLVPAMIIYAQDGRTNDTSVLAVSKTNRAGTMTRIYLPSPGYADLDRFRFEIAKAVFRRYSGAEELPDWLVQGALRAAEPAQGKEDVRLVLSLWRKCRLPFFPALCTDLRVAKGKGAALCGYVAGWIKEKRRMKAILAGLASGVKWDGRRLAEDLTGETDPFAQDRASDERLARLMRAVLVPGTASDFELDVFASHLQLDAPFFGSAILGGRFRCTFREAAEYGADSLMVRLAAALKTRDLPFLALGRGDALAAASAAYVDFLKALASGEHDRETIARKLDAAEVLLEQAYEKNRKDDNRQS